MDLINIITAASAIVDLLVGISSLSVFSYRRGRLLNSWQLGALQCLQAAVMTTVVFLAKAVILLRMGLNSFGLANLVYIDLAIVIPLIGGFILIAATTKAVLGRKVVVTWTVKGLGCLSLCSLPLAIYSTFVEPYRLQVEETTLCLPDIHSNDVEVTVAVLADLQFARVSDHERNAVRLAMEAQPDLILLPGDVFQGSEAAFTANLPEIRALFAELHAPGGVYLVQGDCDLPSRLRGAIEGTDITFLYNQLAIADVKGTRIAIGGVELRFHSDDATEVIRTLQQGLPSADTKILLAHRPAVAMTLGSAAEEIDLVVAGHTHGGQVRIPGFGPPVTLSPIPRAAAAGGLSVVGGARLYVSRGVGCERGQAPRVRFCCPPEVSIIRLSSCCASE